MKLKIDGTPTIAEWLGKELADADSKEVGLDGTTHTAAAVSQLKDELRRQGGLTLRTNFDVLQRIWKDRPPMSLNAIVLQPIKLAGETTRDKLARIRKALREVHADGMLMSHLDDIAWTLNLRGSDVHCCPVFISHLLIGSRQATLFVDERKLTAEVRTYLAEQDIMTQPYEVVGDALQKWGEWNILIDPDEVSEALARQVKTNEIIHHSSPVPAMKAVKNEAEQQGMRNAMLKDGIALVKWLCWLKPAVEAGGQTEISVSQKLEQLRSQQPLYRGLSFDTIAGYEAHGAIVHYEATPETDIPLDPRGLLLVDSGAQYQDGTTDVTRTIALGPLTDEQRKVYTLVLKGHIDLQLLHFPDGAAGTQLDAIARRPLGQAGLNYLHGTGHGVGSYLNVHEGPHQIRMEWKPAPIVAGMTVTDEPGIYLEGRFGVRTENTLLVVPHSETEFGQFLTFEPLTLCPIDRTPIVVEMLTAEERQWLDDYHQMVFDRLSPCLDEEECRWLRQATRPIA
jgi:Xaa-Pro aminopeptidase